MQTKLTLTLDRSIIEEAKLYANDKGRSLSDLIENYLKVVLDKEVEEIKLSKSIANLKGAVKLPDNYDYKKELTKVLSKRFEV